MLHKFSRLPFVEITSFYIEVEDLLPVLENRVTKLAKDRAKSTQLKP